MQLYDRSYSSPTFPDQVSCAVQSRAAGDLIAEGSLEVIQYTSAAAPPTFA